MYRYRIKNPIKKGIYELFFPTKSSLVDHRGKKLENIIDDFDTYQETRKIVTLTRVEDIGCGNHESADVIIDRVPIGSIFMCPATSLEGTGWNFPETVGFVYIKKSVTAFDVSGYSDTGSSRASVTFVGNSEYLYDAENQKWNKILTKADVGEIAHTQFDSVSVENNTKAVAGQVVMPAGTYILQFGGYFSQNANGYRRVHMSTADDPLTAEPYRRRVLSQMGVDGEASYLSGTTFVTTGIPLTISLVVSQGSGENLNFYGYISTVKVG